MKSSSAAVECYCANACACSPHKGEVAAWAMFINEDRPHCPLDIWPICAGHLEEYEYMERRGDLLIARVSK